MLPFDHPPSSSVASSSGKGAPRRGFVDIDEAEVGSPSYNPPHLEILGLRANAVASPGLPYPSQPSSSLQPQYSVYGSKRDMWEKIPPSNANSRKNSIFAAEYAAQQLPQGSPSFTATSRTASLFSSPFASSAPSPVGSVHISTPSPSITPTNTGTPVIKKSRNSIFDIPQVVTKPALKMTPEELEELRNNTSSVSVDTPPEHAEPYRPLPPPLTTDFHPAVLPSMPPPSNYYAMSAASTTKNASPSRGSYPSDFSQHGSSISGGSGHGRRSWVDLDDPGPSSPVSKLANLQPLKPSLLPVGTTLFEDPLSRPTSPHGAVSEGSSSSSSAKVPAPKLSRQRSTPVSSMGSNSNTDAGSGKGAAKGLTVITNPGSAFDNINLSFLPLRKNFLGEGRYAQVYLGQYTVSNPAFSGGTGTGAATARPAPTTGRVAELRQALDPMVVDSPSSAPTPMEVDPILKASLSLAGDRLKHGAESTSGSMSDSTITPMTATPKNTSTSTPPPSSASEVSITPTQSTSTSTSTRASPFLTCAVKRMQNTPEAQSVGLAELFILRRLGNHPNVVRLIGAKDETDVDSFAVRNKIRRASLSSSSPVSSSPTGTAPLPNTLLGLDSSPRLLILLEYAPGGTMWDYIENSRDLGIGQEMWTRWAGQLAAAVEYIHSFGILSETNDLRLADFGNACFVPGYYSPSSLVDPILGLPANLPDSILNAASASNPKPFNLAFTLAPPPANHGGHSNSHSNPACIPPPSPEPPSPTASTSSGSSIGSLRDGLGRGTQAYSAPELFATGPQADAGCYSFPIDIYSVGVTLYVMVSGLEPFQMCRSSVHMMMAIRKGFWASGMQPGIGPYGPMMNGGSAKGGFVERGGHGYLKFANGDRLDEVAVKLLCACVEREPSGRPTAKELVIKIKEWVLDAM